MKAYLFVILLLSGIIFGIGCQSNEESIPTPTLEASELSQDVTENTSYPLDQTLTEEYPSGRSSIQAQSAYPESESGSIPAIPEEVWLVEVIPPTENKATVTGVVLSELNNAPLVNVPIFFAETFYDGDSAAFVLDGAFSPSTVTDSVGRFAFIDIPPGEYVLVIGNPEVTDYEIILDETRKARVWTANANEIVDLGEIQTDVNILP